MDYVGGKHLKLASSLAVSVVLAFAAIGCGGDPCKDSVLVTAEEGTAEYEEQCENLKQLQEELQQVEEAQDSQN